MKTNIFKYILVASLLFSSCSKDLGNYEYTDINTYTVSGIKTGAGVTRNYDVVLGQSISIDPVIESVQENIVDDLSYLWIVESDTISTQRNLKYKVDLPIGLHQGQFVLVDNKTGMKYYTGFAINVTSPFGRGYFFLNENEEGTTFLGFKAVSDTNNHVANTDNIGDVKFGKKPMKMAGVQRFKSGPTDYKWEVYVLSKEGVNPVVLADLTAYNAMRFFDKHAYMGTWGTQYEFKPTHVDLRATGRTYFISNGRIAGFDDAILYRHSLLFDETPDYYLDNALIGDLQRFNGFRSIIGFDLLTSKFKVVSFYPNSVPAKGIISDNNLLDRVLDVESPVGLYDGQRVLGAYSSYNSTTRLLNSKVFTVKTNKVVWSELIASATTPYVPQLMNHKEQTITGLEVGAPITFFENLAGDAYLAIKTKIYKSSIVTLDFAEYLSIDANLGEITALKYQIKSTNSADPRLFICTYNPSSTQKLKGSILVYDVNTKKLIHKLENVTNKVVDIFLGE